MCCEKEKINKFSTHTLARMNKQSMQLRDRKIIYELYTANNAHRHRQRRLCCCVQRVHGARPYNQKTNSLSSAREIFSPRHVSCACIINVQYTEFGDNNTSSYT